MAALRSHNAELVRLQDRFEALKSLGVLEGQKYLGSPKKSIAKRNMDKNPFWRPFECFFFFFSGARAQKVF